VGRLWLTLERFVRGVEQSAGRGWDVITTRLDVGKTSPLRCLPSWDVLTRSTVGMANDRLRTALLQRGLTPAELADAAGVDRCCCKPGVGVAGMAGFGVCEHLLRPALPERRDLVGGALVLPLRGQLPRSGADAHRARRAG
jgi:hypothetical protein